MMAVVSKPSYRHLTVLGADGNEGLLAVGCGDRTRVSDSDFDEMGFGGMLGMHTHLDYRLVNDGMWFELDIKSAIEQLYHLTVTMDFSLDAPSRDFAAVDMAGVAPELILTNGRILDGRIRRLEAATLR